MATRPLRSNSFIAILQDIQFYLVVAFSTTSRFPPRIKCGPGFRRKMLLSKIAPLPQRLVTTAGSSPKADECPEIGDGAHKATSANLFDHLVGAREQRRRNFEAENTGRHLIDH